MADKHVPKNRIRKYFFTIAPLCFLLFLSCGKFQSSISLKSDETIIDAGKNMKWAFGNNYTSWTPESKDIESAETILSKAFDDQKKPTVNRLLDRKTDDYFKQFVGFVDANGDKIIWVNCFCKGEESSFKNWKNRVVFVSDGGNCFFNVKINITKNTYYDLMVNGVA